MFDWCIDGICVGGEQMPCDEGHKCDEGICVCDAPCEGQECGFDSCGGSCGVCDEWQECSEGNCIDLYPGAPYGPNAGQTNPNHVFIDPEDMSEVAMGSYWKEGKLLLVTYNAGWCIVCKNDTWLLNSWHQSYYDDGLRIMSVMYETPYQAPITQDYALYWKKTYKVLYDLFMDTPTADPEGKAQQGNLSFYYKPAGPIKAGTFPATMLICPDDMRILYIGNGFYDDIVTPLVQKYLFSVDCATD